MNISFDEYIFNNQSLDELSIDEQLLILYVVIIYYYCIFTIFKK